MTEIATQPIQLTLFAGGAPPDTNVLRLKGKVELEHAELQKGQVLELRVTARVVEVHFVDVYKDDVLEHTERRHVAEIESVEFVDEHQEE